MRCNSQESFYEITYLSAFFGRNVRSKLMYVLWSYRYFSLACAARTSKNQRSSNRPFQCAICDNIFCSYFMENHYAQSHAGVACPNNLII
jgi:hypothetical protein